MRRRFALLLSALLAAPVVAVAATSPPPALTYEAHVASLGWMGDVSSPATAGTTGQARQMEALRVAGGTLADDIDYRAHVAGIGWLGWVGPAYVAGTTGQARALEAVQVRLTGQSATLYSVECRAHVAGLGWLPWVRDGATCGTTGQARRAEAVQLRLVAKTAATPTPTPTPTPTATVTPAPDGAVRVAVTADVGMEDTGAAVMTAIGRSDAQWVAVLGDLAYRPNVEDQWCAWVKARVSQPVQILPGNHEAQDGDGSFSKYAACLPDRVGVAGVYGDGQWLYDDGPLRWISITPGINLPTGARTYAKGTVEREWLKDRIDEAKNQGRWVVVAMHMPCLTNGVHGCSSDPTLTDMLIGKRVDLVLAGHDHTYGRTHQLTGTVAAPVVVDRDGQMTSGAGTVLAVVGNGGHNPRPVTASGGIWAVSASGTSAGYAALTVTPDRLTYTMRAVTGPALTDSWTITR